MKKIIIVGTNHAGTIAARTLKQINPKARVVAYDRNNNISFLGCGIALWVKGEFDDPKGLFYANPNLLKREGIEVNMNHEVVKLDRSRHQITVRNLKNQKVTLVDYDKIIFALGSWPIIPPIPGINLEGVEIVKWFQHGRLIKTANQSSAVKRIAVCGAGYIGVELVDAFATNGKQVTLFDICDRIMPNYYDQEFTDPVQKAMTDHGVKLCLGEKVLEFKGKNGKVQEVITDKGRYPVDMVIWSVGFRPATKILKGQVKLSPSQAIIVDRHMRTSDPDIYAIGDCIEVYENPKHGPAYIALATTALRTGIIAALNIGNKAISSPGFQGSNAICVFGWSLSASGLSEVACQRFKVPYETTLVEDYDRPEFMQEKYKVRFKLIWHKKTRELIGAQIGSLCNHTEVMYMLSLAIKQKVKIDDVALTDIFFLPHFNKPFNFITKAGLQAIGLHYPEPKLTINADNY